MDRFLQLLGIAARAGALVSGEFAVEQAIRNKEADLVIVAGDASDNTKKHFRDMCAYRDIPFLITADRSQLGRHTGKTERVSVGILDQGFARALISITREG